MPLKLNMPAVTELKPRITVFGVGGAGGNAVNNMIQSELEGVDFVVANTDSQALAGNRAERKIQIGSRLTQGLGAGARPEVGQGAAEESIEEILEHLQGAHMCFITAGMGGGTGTGAAPVIARMAREQGILTVGVVTKPFHFEGAKRMRLADEGIRNLQQYVDTLIIIPNQNLFRIANERTTFAEAFKLADEVLHSGVRGITDLMVMPGLINLDFADVRTVMNEMGKAMMGTGEAEGQKRAVEAAEAAIANPLLDDVAIKGARGVLINITGGMDLTLFEVDEAANRIRDEVDPDANIIVGSTFDERLAGRMRVSVVATGIEAEIAQQPQPKAAQVHTLPSGPRLGVRGAPALKTTSSAAVADAPAARIQPVPQPAPAPQPAASAPQPMTAQTPNPVHAQVETLQREVAQPPAPKAEEPRLRAPQPVAKAETLPDLAPLAPEPAPQPAMRPLDMLKDMAEKQKQAAAAAREPAAPLAKKSGGLLGGFFAKAPAGKAQPPLEPRAARPAEQAAPKKPAELKPDYAHGLFAGEGEQAPPLDIPTFLRRQSN